MRSAGVFLFSVLGLSLTITAQKPAPPTLESLLASAGSYLETYSTALGAVACVERAQEIASIGTSSRTVRSEIVLLSGGPTSWLAFRDAYEVNGSEIRPRDGRLVAALSGPPATAIEHARRITGEGAKHHTGANYVNRAINSPLLALAFLARENQSRSEFSFGGMKSVEGTQAGLVTFKERAKPRVLLSADEAAADGRFWIQPDTGRVVQSELSMKSTGKLAITNETATVAAKIAVRYADQPALGLWLPSKLDEEFSLFGLTAGGVGSSVSNSQNYSGRLDYSSCRKLDIDARRFAR